MSYHVSEDHLFTFAIVADTHVTEAEATAIGGYDVDTVKLGAARSAYVVRELNRLAPDFVVHLGDITHPEPGTPAYEDSAERFHTVYEALECPLYLVAGNHDIGEKAFVGEPLLCQQAQRTVNDDMIAEYERHFQAQYYSFEHQDCLFVIINGMIVNSGLVCEEQQRQWLESLLDANPRRRVFMFSHYPPYLSRKDETGHYDATDEPGRSRLLGVLERHRVEAFYAGHVHNFFFNRHGDTSCYVLPSVCFLRHDYHELFRVAPGMKQGRHDGAKLGYAVVQVHSAGHLNHIVRTHGRTDDPAGEADHPLPLVHGLAPNHGGVGLDLRQPWCDSANIPTPWGLDVFRRKRVRNDYPLLALWEMGIRNLRVPLDDLADAETRNRMAELTALGHRFTAYSYGLPKGAARQALTDHGQILSAWEVIAPTTSAPELLADIAALKGGTQVFFNAYRAGAKTFSGSHGLDADEYGTAEALLALDGARQAIDGLVFGIRWREAPVPAMIAARDSVAGLGVMAAVHVQFAHRRPLEQDEIERHDANRIAEAVVGALAHDDMAVFLDNFTGIDRGYYFSGGLVDRLYNPLSGAHIVRHLHAALPDGCQIGAMSQNNNDRVVELRKPDGTLLLPAADTDPASLPSVPSRTTGHWIDLNSGKTAVERLTGPALVIPE
ncbi:MAG: metallophosphoesterase [Alphaproteobacteria bacterium]|nr:metallophosphoesterase [Alphaproteobacteria bacterium]MDP6812101.1 metallophosphoesterase [Alphaproteobacteria bacterium]